MSDTCLTVSGIPQPFLDLFEAQIFKVVKLVPATSPSPVLCESGKLVFNTQYVESQELCEGQQNRIAKGLESASISLASTITTWTGHLQTKIEEYVTSRN